MLKGRNPLTSLFVALDCPHRERLGYTGDGQLVCETGLLLTDSQTLYEKWLQDILDGQDHQTGHVQHTAPFYGGGGGPGGWGSAIVEIPWQLYQYTGNPEVLERYWSPMLRYADYLQNRSIQGLVVSEEKDGWCLGDWCGHPETRLPEPFVNTYFHIRSLMRLEKIADILGKPFPYADRLAETRFALRKVYHDEETHTCCGGVQGADAFYLDLGLGDEEMLVALMRHYEEAGTLDTGIFGTEILLRILCESGHADTAFRLMSTTAFPSFGYMMTQSATTLWEDWDGHSSHNHPMFGACVKLLFQAFLGIRQRRDTAGFVDIVIEPLFVEGLQHVSGSLVLPTGTLSVEWKRWNPKETKDINCLIRLSGIMRAEFQAQDRRWILEQGDNHLTLQG